MTDIPLADDDKPTFAVYLATLARGTLNDEATMALAELVEAVAHLGKKGTMTVELTVEPSGSSGRLVNISGKVKTKAPEPDPELSVRFVGEAGTLHYDDPYRSALPGIPHRDAEGTPKVVDPATGEVRKLTDDEVARLPRPITDTQEDTTE